MFTEMSFELLDVPEAEMFTIEHKRIKLPAYAPIFSSATCTFCGEKVMETRIKERDGKPACISCADAGYYELNGAGITHVGDDE